MKHILIVLLLCGLPVKNWLPAGITPQQALTYKGHVSFWNNMPKKELALYFVTGKTAHYVVLQKTKAVTDFADGTYNVVLANEYLSLQTDDGRRYLFGVKSKGRSEDLNQYMRSNRFEMTDMSSVGLIHNYGPNEKFLTIAEVKARHASVLDYLGSGR